MTVQSSSPAAVLDSISLFVFFCWITSQGYLTAWNHHHHEYHGWSPFVKLLQASWKKREVTGNPKGFSTKETFGFIGKTTGKIGDPAWNTPWESALPLATFSVPVCCSWRREGSSDRTVMRQPGYCGIILPNLDASRNFRCKSALIGSIRLVCLPAFI